MKRSRNWYELADTLVDCVAKTAEVYDLHAERVGDDGPWPWLFMCKDDGEIVGFMAWRMTPYIALTDEAPASLSEVVDRLMEDYVEAEHHLRRQPIEKGDE